MSLVDRLSITPAAALVVTALAIQPLAAESPDAPISQDPSADARNLRRVERFTHVAAFLNLAQGTVRVVAIVPTDSRSSLGVVDTLASIVTANASKRLRAYVIMRGGTDAESSLRAALLAGRASDPRIVFFWDPSGAVSQAWAPTGAGGVWLYDTSARFSDGPPEPSLAVAAITGGPARLDGAALRSASAELVRRVEAKMAGNGP